MRDAILADGGLDDAERQKRLLALDEKLCMLENAADEQVTHKNLDVYSQELVQTCLAKMCIDEQVRRGERVRRAREGAAAGERASGGGGGGGRVLCLRLCGFFCSSSRIFEGRCK
jgi:hypothetical protein